MSTFYYFRRPYPAFGHLQTAELFERAAQFFDLASDLRRLYIQYVAEAGTDLPSADSAKQVAELIDSLFLSALYYTSAAYSRGVGFQLPPETVVSCETLSAKDLGDGRTPRKEDAGHGR